MKILVIGARGMLGRDLMKVLATEKPVGLDLPELDITDAGSCRSQMEELAPELVINAAAFTNVDACETQQDEALRINGYGAGNIAAAAHALGALLVHYSTDYVFDGSAAEAYHEDDRPHPLSVYGRSKLLGEEQVAQKCPNHLILRTSWLFGCHGKNFIRTIVEAARAGRPLQVVDDQRGSPTYALDLAAQTRGMVDAGCRGIYHVTNQGACTWYELACRSVEYAGLNARIEPVKTYEVPRPAPRPACSVLANTRLERQGLARMRPWQEAVQSYVSSCLRN
jgi:dTDP-4-dehydrorhamnose reductase